MPATYRETLYKSKETSYCQLCSDGEEDNIHFLLKCNSLETVRKSFMNALSNLLLKFDISVRKSSSSDIQLLHLITDVTHVQSIPLILQNDANRQKLESIARGLCFILHREGHVEFWRLRQGEISFTVDEWDINLFWSRHYVQTVVITW